MSSVPLRPDELLHYVPEHRVLICKECHYAIQPSAISRHLKELHRIYRSKRREFIQYATSFDLADPKDIASPGPDEGPVPGLTITKGLVCEVSRCRHLCATTKRMKMHWATQHVTVTDDEPHWRPVHLQTFFRGNQLRYFIVQQQSRTSPQTGLSSIDKDTTGTLGQYHWTCDAQLRAAMDLKLLEHFQTCTSQEIGYDATTRELWHTDVPDLAVKHSFLMHGILACSALHLAFLNPLEKHRYKLMAAYHQSIALPPFRSEIANPTINNCFSLVIFTQLLIIHSFAAEQHNEDLLVVGGNGEISLPDWLYVIRGSCSIFHIVGPHISEGRFVALLSGGVEREHLEALAPGPEMSDILERLRRLTDMLRPNLLKSNGSLQTSSLPSTLLILTRAFARALAAQSQNNYTMWTAIHTWPVQVPQDYLDLLKRRDPAALILLAHYCVLLRPLDTNWYMRGYCKRLLSRIYSQLEEEWRPWLEWPLEEIGLTCDAQ